MFAVEVKNISKTFPGVLALDNVSLSIEKNEVHAIVGENGAGKSTLMKILGGVYPADRGQILINGKEVSIKNIDESHAAGISVIFQEFNLMPELTVAENLYVSDLPVMKGLGAVKYGQLNSKAQALLDELELSISPKAYVKDLSVSEKQMVEIGKALSINSEIIIMDEPTATLNNNEVEKLYSIIRKLKKQGKTILYISHRMKEIFDISDRLTVLRDGRYVGTANTKDITGDDIVKMMIGRDVSNFYSTAPVDIGKTILEVKSINKKDIFENISFSLKQGEILGFAGLMGSGREEIMKALYGLIELDSGEVILEGKPLKMKSPKHTMKRGMAFVTDDRKDAGIFEQMTVKENLSINVVSSLCKIPGLYLDDAKEKDLLQKYTEFMSIKYSDETQRIMFLSGGNQQKVLLSRALAGDCKVLLLLEPTRGIDVGAKAEIYALLRQLANKGLAIIVASSELPEIISICNRSLIIWQGKITGELSKEEMTEEAIMLRATGRRIEGGTTR